MEKLNVPEKDLRQRKRKNKTGKKEKRSI